MDDQRIYVIAEAIRKGMDYDTIHELTQIDVWFIDKIAILVEMEQALKEGPLTVELLREAKRIEFPDNVISRLTGVPEEEIKKLRYDNGIVAVYKMVDTCAAEFAASTPYYYSVFGGECEARRTEGRKRCWCWVPAPSASARASSSITVPCTPHGRFPRRAMRRLSSTTIPRR